MIEAQVQCVCGGIKLPDLKLDLIKGQTIFMDATRARASKDLQRAWQAKAVTIKYVQRFRERRAASVPPVSPLHPHPMVAAPNSEPVRHGQDILLVDPDAIAARVVAELAKSPIHDSIRVEVGRQLQSLEDRLVTRITDSVLSALEGIAIAPRGATAQKMAGIDPEVDDTVPVFTPSKIGGDLQADLGLQSSQKDAGVVSGAAAALRAAREVGKNDG